MHAASLWLKKNRYRADQVQTFLPSPMATATAMYHTGVNTLKGVRRGGDREGRDRVRVARQRRLHRPSCATTTRELAAPARGVEGDGPLRPDRLQARPVWFPPSQPSGTGARRQEAATRPPSRADLHHQGRAAAETPVALTPRNCDLPVAQGAASGAAPAASTGRRSRQCHGGRGSARGSRGGPRRPEAARPPAGNHREIRVGGQEGAHLRLVLLGQQRAGGIDEPPRGFTRRAALARSGPAAQAGCPALLLGRAPGASGLRRHVPVAAAGRIDQHPVEPALWRFTQRSVSLARRPVSALCRPARRRRSAQRPGGPR